MKKITRHVQQQENVTHKKEENQSRETKRQ